MGIRPPSNSNRRLSRDGLSLPVLARAFAFTLAAATALALSLSARADDGMGTQAPPPQFSFTNPDQYQECGQACLYQKANENLSLQALYTIQKLQRIRDSIMNSQTSPLEAEQAVHEIQPYCLDYFPSRNPQHGDSGFDDNAKKCLYRYIEVQAPLLRQMRKAIVQNEDHAALLQSKAAIIESRNPPPARRPQTPYLPTLAELDAQQKRDASYEGHLERLTTNEYKKWIDDAVPKPPSCESEFPITRPMPRDPSNPSAGSFTVIERDKNGMPKVDAKLCSQATAQYNQELAIFKHDMEGYKADLSQRPDANSKTPVYEAEPIQKENISVQAYGAARYQMKMVTDQLLMDKGVATRHELEYSGKSSDRRADKGASRKVDHGTPIPPSDPRALLEAANKPSTEGAPTTKSTGSEYTVGLDPAGIDDALANDVYKTLDVLKNDSALASVVNGATPPPKTQPSGVPGSTASTRNTSTGSGTVSPPASSSILNGATQTYNPGSGNSGNQGGQTQGGAVPASVGQPGHAGPGPGQGPGMGPGPGLPPPESSSPLTPSSGRD